jgi:hypothetical protein
MTDSPICPTCGQMKPGSALDWAEFGLQIRLTMARRNMSYREVAAAIQSDQATVHRVAKHGKPITAETYHALSVWMQKEPRND